MQQQISELLQGKSTLGQSHSVALKLSQIISTVVILIFLGSVSLADDTSDAKLIVGTWAGINEGAPKGYDKNYTVTFDSGGRFFRDGQETGNWTIEKGKLLIALTKQFIGGGYTKECSYDLNGDRLTFRELYAITPDGKREQVTRPKEDLRRKK